MKITLRPFRLEFEFNLFDGSCLGKVKYNHRDTAEEAAQQMNSKPTTRRRLEPYKCRVCGGYHLGGVT